MSVAMKWLKLLFFIRDALGSNIGRKPPFVRHYRDISESLQENYRRCLLPPSLSLSLSLSRVETESTWYCGNLLA
jgi:hypothetical protein